MILLNICVCVCVCLVRWSVHLLVYQCTHQMYSQRSFLLAAVLILSEM